ncbi:MAG: class I SAM-dependent methyltransferase [Methanosphaera stadtmanae]|nr:class I SAM-dependent methyltransferase [Methanosphaera stadtmanae]
MENKDYWAGYYKKHPNPVEPSTFAQFCTEYIQEGKKLIELGCGNGRDSVYFRKKNLNVTAIDQVDEEVAYLNEKYGDKCLEFIAKDFSNLRTDKFYDYIYSRFTLHSIDQEAEKRVFKWISHQLNSEGYFFLEVRSLNDPMFKKGEQISDTENITTHYRRYLDFEDTVKKLEELGLNVVYKIESQGLAVYKDDDPMLIRIIAKKE